MAKKKQKPKEHHRLPDGTSTTSERRYVDTWRKLGKHVCEIMGWRHAYAFDPDLAIDTGRGNAHLDVDVALKLVELDKARR